MGGLRIVALRPYSARIRSKVFAVLERLGAEVETTAEPSASDAEAAASLRGLKADALLIPFNAHRDRAGRLVHGLSLIRRVREEVAEHRRTLVICPVSRVGLAAAELLSPGLDDPLLQPLLVLHEGQLDTPAADHALTCFLRRRAS